MDQRMAIDEKISNSRRAIKSSNHRALLVAFS